MRKWRRGRVAHRRRMPGRRLLGDGEAHRERRHELTDVAEIARCTAARPRPARRLVQHEACTRGVVMRDSREDRVRPRLFVHRVRSLRSREWVIRDDLETRAGLEGRTFRDAAHLLADLFAIATVT